MERSFVVRCDKNLLMSAVWKSLDRIGYVEQPSISKVSVLIQACNLFCPMCSMNVNNSEIGQILRDYPGASSGGQLKLDEYKHFFRGIAEHKPTVSIGGGEPMNFNHMTELVEFLVNELGLTVGMTTNGTLFRGDQIKRLASLPIAITVSIDGNRRTHDSIRGEGNFDISIQTLREFVKIKRSRSSSVWMSSLFCIQEDNYTELEEVAELLIEDVGIDGLTGSFLVFSTQQTLTEHENWIGQRDLPEYYRIELPRGGESSKSDFSRFDFPWLFETKEKLKNRFDQLHFEPDFSSLEDLERYFLTNIVMPKYFAGECRPAKTTFTLISNGDVLFFPQCFQMKLGNIRQNSADEVWNSERFREIRRILSSDLSPVCAHCCANRVEKVGT